jgi:hypothetical protein
VKERENLLYYEDEICGQDSAEAMCDDEECVAMGVIEFLQCILNGLFRPGERKRE